MKTEPILDSDGPRSATGFLEPLARLGDRIGRRLLHEAREALPPTLFFFVGFNFIVLTTGLLVPDYGLALGNYMFATLGALVVGKAVLTANQIPWLRRYDRAPMIQPILYKTAFYWVIVFIARMVERFAEFLHGGNAPGNFIAYLRTSFPWQRFHVYSLWIFALFLIYVTASEFAHLFGAGELRRLFFTTRPTELQLNRRQRIRELLRLSRLMDAHSAGALRDPASPAHHELIGILNRLARQ
jgi:hypothetical protein